MTGLRNKRTSGAHSPQTAQDEPRAGLRRKTFSGLNRSEQRPQVYERTQSDPIGSRRLRAWMDGGGDPALSSWFEPLSVRTFTFRILSEAPQHPKLLPGIWWDLWQLHTLHRWVNAHITYQPDPPGLDFWAPPMETLQGRRGDCDDHALLFASMALAVGARARLRCARTPEGDCHAFAEVSPGLRDGHQRITANDPNALLHMNAYAQRCSTEGLGFVGNPPLHYTDSDGRVWMIADTLSSKYLGDGVALQRDGFLKQDWNFLDSILIYPNFLEND